MIERTIFREEHHIFRESVRRFVDREIVPFHAQWEKDGIVPRELWLKAGAEGLLCCTVPEEYGGMGLDYLFDVVVFEELWRSGASGPGFLIHTDLVATYLLSFGTEAQKRQWLPKMVSGEAIGSLGMTEPHAGSDLKAIRTRAVRDGDDFVINGQKVFISNGQLCDFVVLATKTDGSAGAKGVTLFIVESNRPGFQRGRNLEKIGMKAQDTSELFFENIRIPATNMLGQEGKGFALMMTKLSQERLAQAIRSATVTETVLDWTVEYTSDRSVFGKSSPTSRTPSSSSPISRPRRRSPASLPIDASRSSWKESSIRSTPRWPRCSPPNFTAKRSMNACNCSAAGAI